MAKEKEPKNEIVEKLLDQIDFHGLSQEEVLGKDGLIKTLTKRVLERALESEMDYHLGYEKHSNSGDRSGDSRNGYSSKKVIAENREVEIRVPRDRNGSFEPAVVGKYQKRTPLFNDQIISLYARGMTVREIKTHLEEIYGVEVSGELISRVTDAVIEDVGQWRTRPLDSSYPIVFLDALRVNTRQDGKSISKALYIALGIDWDGRKSVLGMWLAETEGAKFWAAVLTELRNRGVQDILIACTDGLTGFPDAIRAVFPDTHVQLCIVHMVRNSTRYVSYKDLKKVCGDLKKIYGAPTEEAACNALEDFGSTWDAKYPMIRKSWESRWNDLNEFFNYPEPIRKVIYTTNAIESLNSRLRKVTKSRSTFPTDDAIYKIMYLALTNAAKKWTMPLQNWGQAVNQFSILFPDRIPGVL
jgi:transposase-like protein